MFMVEVDYRPQIILLIQYLNMVVEPITKNGIPNETQLMRNIRIRLASACFYGCVLNQDE